MNGFIDPVRGEMAAVDCASCSGCAYEHDKAGCRAAPSCRTEGGIRSIIWVPAADAPRAPKPVRPRAPKPVRPRAPKPVRLTDEQIMAAARAIERAVLRANNLEISE